jgi:hypothetical protein
MRAPEGVVEGGPQEGDRHRGDENPARLLTGRGWPELVAQILVNVWRPAQQDVLYRLPPGLLPRKPYSYGVWFSLGAGGDAGPPSGVPPRLGYGRGVLGADRNV